MIVEKMFLAAAFALTFFSAGSVAAAPAGYQEPLGAQTLNTIKTQFSQLNWIRVEKDWKVASEIILPVPPAPAG
jgi:hypothetical protein